MGDVYSNSEKHVVLSNNVKIPILGLGTSHNGGYSHDAVVYALKECGYRHIDTAKRYGCESLIAQSIKSSGVQREDIFLATKCWPSDYGKEKLQSAFKGSAQRLQTSYIDLYMLHWPEVPTGYNRKALIEESWRALELLYDDGLVRSIGVSNFLEHHLESLLEDCSIVPHVNQCEFHPFNNPKSLREMCADNGILFEGHSPFANGEVFSDPIICSLSVQPSTDMNERQSKHYPLSISGPLKTPSQIIMRWNIENRVVCIPKSTKKSRILENMEIFNFELNSYEMSVLNNLPRKLTVMDWSSMQSKLDNPQPDGYKLKLPKATKTFVLS